MLDYPVFRRYSFNIILFSSLVGGREAFAQSCVVDGPRYSLTADTVDWSMKIMSGRTCVRGVRFSNIKFESMKLVSPPQSGQVALQGPGIRYTAKAEFESRDSFTVMVFGMANNIHGSSTIHVTVSLAGSLPERRARSIVDPTPAPITSPQGTGQPINNEVPLPAGATLQPCPIWDWSKGAPPPMRPPFDRSKLYCPPLPFEPPNPPVGCTCPGQ